MSKVQVAITTGVLWDAARNGRDKMAPGAGGGGNLPMHAVKAVDRPS